MRIENAGKTMPFFMWGCMADRLTLAGRIGSLIWNPPDVPAPSDWNDRSRRFYAEVQWAVDITEAEFTTTPTFRCGPPGELFRRDPVRQPLVTRNAAVRALESTGREAGVWAVILEDLLASPWPNSTVLIPSDGAAKSVRDREQAGLDLLASVGAFDEDPARR